MRKNLPFDKTSSPLKNENVLFHTGFCKYVVKCSEQIKISLTHLFTSVFIIAQNEMANLT
ncbi:MAG TPA: hypothetical protein P5150_03120 [Candidatus Ratteibacteria bacterium]|nr:hypothetical protein [bacterium]HRR95708.1 hypothetical protein [Candidatus Ratteibacteria bacterium]